MISRRLMMHFYSGFYKNTQKPKRASVMSDLVLQTAVLSLRVLPDDHDVDVLVASLDCGEGLAVHHIGIQV